MKKGCRTNSVRHLFFIPAKFTKAFPEQTVSTTGKGYCYHADVMAYAQKYGERKSLNEKNK